MHGLPPGHRVVAPGQLGSWMQRLHTRELSAERDLHLVPRWHLLEDSLGGVQPLPQRHVFIGERNRMQNVRCWEVQPEREQRDLPVVQCRVVRARPRWGQRVLALPIRIHRGRGRGVELQRMPRWNLRSYRVRGVHSLPCWVLGTGESCMARELYQLHDWEILYDARGYFNRDL